MFNPRAIRFFMILVSINGALLMIGIFTGIFSFFLFFLTIPLSALGLLVIEKTGSFLGNILSAWTPGRVDYYDQFAADLQKSRYSKRMGHFDEALRIVNDVLHRVPDFPDALLLKAHIMWEGFGNAEASKAYLKRVKELVPKGEPLHQWASGYHDDVTKRVKSKKVGGG